MSDDDARSHKSRESMSQLGRSSDDKPETPSLSELTMASETVTQSTACTRLEHSSCGVRLNTFECTLVLGASNSDTAKFVLLSAFADDTFFRHLAVVARGSTNMQYDHFPVVSDPTLLKLPRNMRRKYRT